MTLSTSNAQAAYKVLHQCAVYMLDYYWAVTPPVLATRAYYLFDTLIMETATRIFSPAGYITPQPAQLRSRRAAALQALPIRLGGGGLPTAASTGPGAFVAACAAVGTVEPLYNTVLPTLAPHLQDALDAICTQCSCDSSAELPPAIHKAISFQADGQILSTLYSPDLPHPRRKKLQSIISTAIATSQRALLLESCDPDKVPPVCGQDEYDMYHTSLVLLRSQATRILQSPLWFRENRIPTLPFIFFWRYYLGLPRLIRCGRPTLPPIHLPPPSQDQLAWWPMPGEYGPAPVPDTEPAPQLEVCALNHGCAATMSATGAHTCACWATYGARYGTHNGYTHVLYKAAEAAVAPGTTEPTTRAVLLEAFTEDECRALCPRAQSKKATAIATTVARLAESIQLLLPGTREHAEQTNALRQALAEARDKRATKGVRFDIMIELRAMTILADVAGVHPTAKSLLAALRSWRRKVADGLSVSAGVVANNPTARLPSPAVVRTEISKQQRYKITMQLARNQFPRLRKSKPVLLIPIVTHLGEMSPDMITMVEHLTCMAGADYVPSYMTMGQPRKRFTGAFRSRLKDHIMAVNARGFGRALMAAGNPMTGHVLDPADIDLPSWEEEY